MNNYFTETNKCRLTKESLDDSEIIVSFDSLPIPGLFFDSKADSADKMVPMTLVLSKGGLFQLKETLNGNLYHYYKSRRADKNHIDWIENIANQIKDRFKQYSNILEVGGGEGMLLQHLFNKDYKSLYNIDPSHENESSKYFESITGLFPNGFDKEKYKGYFSCIIGQHFLEHVPEPLEVMEGAYNLLTDDGELWIEVPDLESSVLESYFQIGIIYPLHLSYFTKQSLKNIGERAGLFLKSIEIVDHYGKSIWAKFSKEKKSDRSFDFIENNTLIIQTIKNYFEEIQNFSKTIPKELICWGAAERAHTTYAILSNCGIKAASIFDSNEEIKGMFISGVNTPIMGINDFPLISDHILILSPPNHKSIVDGIKDLISNQTVIHIPLIGSYNYEKYKATFY
jgi:hypothetical protein